MALSLDTKYPKYRIRRADLVSLRDFCDESSVRREVLTVYTVFTVYPP